MRVLVFHVLTGGDSADRTKGRADPLVLVQRRAPGDPRVQHLGGPASQPEVALKGSEGSAGFWGLEWVCERSALAGRPVGPMWT